MDDANEPLVLPAGLRHRSNSRRSGLQEVKDLNSPKSTRSSCHEKVRAVCSRVLENKPFKTSLFLITIFALIGDDIRLGATAKTADIYFDIVTCVSLVAFSLEIVLASIAKDGYFLGFFFVLDTVATLSLVLDLTMVAEALAKTLSGEGSQNQGDVARAGRASRVGTRAGRIVRVIRLIRLIRIVKLYKQALDARAKQPELGLTTPGESDSMDDENHAESRVGKKLSEMTTRRVIILVLSMLLVLPNIKPVQYFEGLPTSAVYGADVVNQASQTKDRSGGEMERQQYEKHLLLYLYYHNWWKDGCQAGKACTADALWRLCWVGIRIQAEDIGNPPLDRHIQHYEDLDQWDGIFKDERFIMGTLPLRVKQRLTAPWDQLCKIAYFSDQYGKGVSTRPEVDCPYEYLRFTEVQFISPMLTNASLGFDDNVPPFVFAFDMVSRTSIEALLSIAQTFFVCIILAFGALTFSKDANEMVLNPIERMISKVEKIRDNPLYAMKLGDEQYKEKLEDEDAPGGQTTRKTSCCKRRVSPSKAQTMETKILENAIIKLGSLLAVGFGEAGSEIIGQNMDDDTATVNAMIPGTKVEAVFGFFDIRHFTDITEVLQDKVMVFVNQVAEIVHNVADTWNGAANKNIGEAFLVLWRMADGQAHQKSKIADMSVMSFVQIVAGINKSLLLSDYRGHPGLRARLGRNYRVSMGFGMHFGWAIEGAIGSEFKIDASYLSPHVNAASRLESATKQYDVTVLMSDDLSRCCSTLLARHFRPVDHVTLKGMKFPVRVHTLDLDGDALPTDTHVSQKDTNRYRLRLTRDQAKTLKMGEKFNVYEFFLNDPDVQLMRQRYPKTFFNEFTKGYLNYEAGEWDVAKESLGKTVNQLGYVDGPSVTLLEYMKRWDFVAPPSWQGWRKLAAK